MNLTEQMQQLLGSWTEAQQNIASQWTSALRQTGGPGQTTAEDWAAQWREQATQNFQDYLGKVGGVPGSVAQRMASGAQTYHRFVEFVTEALRDMVPKVQSGANWTDAITQSLQALQGKMGDQPQLWQSPASAAAAAGDAAELGRLFFEQARNLATPWFESLGQTRGQFGEAMGGDHRAAIRMANLFTDTFESTMGKMLGGPAIGYSREHQEKLTKTFDSWVAMKKAEGAFQTELVTIGFRALQDLVEALKDKAAKGEKLENPRQLFDLWVEIAEKTYFAAASTEAFAQAQADLVNASMHHRVQERVLLDIFYKAVHLPTRQEIDDAYKHLHGLRTQVKQLTKTVASLQGEMTSLQEFRQTTLDAAEKSAKAAARASAAPAAAPAKRKAAPRGATRKVAKATENSAPAPVAPAAAAAPAAPQKVTTARTPRTPRTPAKEA